MPLMIGALSPCCFHDRRDTDYGERDKKGRSLQCGCLFLEKAIGGAGSTHLVTWKQDIMETPDYLQEERKFAQRDLPAAPGAPPPPRTNEATTRSKLIRAPAARLIDFFEGGARLPGGFEGSSQEFEANRSAKEAAARRLTAVARMDRLEESAYWLLSAATLVYLLLGIISH
jgi:hypothetical protein